MKIKFNSDELMIMKPIENPTITVDQGIFLENNKYYSQVFLDECLSKLQKRYIMIELTFWEKLMLKKQVHQKRVVFITIDIS